MGAQDSVLAAVAQVAWAIVEVRCSSFFSGHFSRLAGWEHRVGEVG